MSAPTSIQAIAKVQITIEVRLSQPWGPEATMAEAYRSAKAEALGRVQALKHIEVVDTPVVSIITFETKSGGG